MLFVGRRARCLETAWLWNDGLDGLEEELHKFTPALVAELSGVTVNLSTLDSMCQKKSEDEQVVQLSGVLDELVEDSQKVGLELATAMWEKL